MSASLSPAHGVLLAVVTIVASTAASAWIVWQAAHPLPPSPTTTGQELQPLIERLDALTARLAESLERAPTTGATQLRERIADSETGAPATASELADLVNAIDRLVVAQGGSSARNAAPPLEDLSPRARAQPVHWDALRLLAEQTQQDAEAARRSVLFLTPRQIVNRFGLPTAMGGQNGRVWFDYEYPQDDLPESVELHFVFNEGMLMHYTAKIGG